ncbi:MAG: type I restriction enzyme HsdR N-terminal domain-containing protein, partial [Bacteroidales bacterium]|nr:type I restriction enzyme HsdR N-terminal domain-containing protein [Bacteroidales bacterium]
MTEEIFDIIRKRYVALTPEEKVRQHIVSVLINEKQIPQSYISVEAQIKVGKLIKRYDILVYD